jgi:hypothetical protein
MPERWPEGLAGNRSNREKRHINQIPVVEMVTAHDYTTAFRGWCACGWETPPYTEIEPAEVDSWRHAFPDHVSDLRVVKNGVSMNGNGHKAI